MKLSLNVKLRNIAFVFILLISIGLIAYNFGSVFKDLETLPRTRTVEYRKSDKMSFPSAKSFWDDSIDIEINIPDDVLVRAEKLIITEKTVLVDVSTIRD